MDLTLWALLQDCWLLRWPRWRGCQRRGRMLQAPPAAPWEDIMLDALLETIGTLGILASIAVKLAASLPKAPGRSRTVRQQ